MRWWFASVVIGAYYLLYYYANLFMRLLIETMRYRCVASICCIVTASLRAQNNVSVYKKPPICDFIVCKLELIVFMVCDRE